MKSPTIISCLLGLLTWTPQAVASEKQPDPAALFATHKCNLCHAITAVGIEAKTKSQKLLGPDLGGFDSGTKDLAWLKSYLRKQAEHNGQQHKREFKGTDAEIEAILNWIAKQPAAPD